MGWYEEYISKYVHAGSLWPFIGALISCAIMIFVIVGIGVRSKKYKFHDKSKQKLLFTAIACLASFVSTAALLFFRMPEGFGYFQSTGLLEPIYFAVVVASRTIFHCALGCLVATVVERFNVMDDKETMVGGLKKTNISLQTMLILISTCLETVRFLEIQNMTIQNAFRYDYVFFFFVSLLFISFTLFKANQYLLKTITRVMNDLMNQMETNGNLANQMGAYAKHIAHILNMTLVVDVIAVSSYVVYSFFIAPGITGFIWNFLLALHIFLEFFYQYKLGQFNDLRKSIISAHYPAPSTRHPFPRRTSAAV